MLYTAEAPRQLQLPDIAPMRPRPRCERCTKPGPTINGRCAEHPTFALEGQRDTASAEDAIAYYAAEPEPKLGL